MSFGNCWEKVIWAHECKKIHSKHWKSYIEGKSKLKSPIIYVSILSFVISDRHSQVPVEIPRYFEVVCIGIWTRRQFVCLLIFTLIKITSSYENSHGMICSDFSESIIHHIYSRTTTRSVSAAVTKSKPSMLNIFFLSLMKTTFQR